MSLVEYSSSDSDTEDKIIIPCNQSIKRKLNETGNDEGKKRLPNNIKSIQFGKSLTEIIDSIPDDNKLNHDGRKRSFAHERGNWSTLIYINCEQESSEQNDAIKLLQTQIIEYCERRQLNINIKPINALHISLTKTLILQHHWIDLFKSSISDTASTISSFKITLDNLNIYCNEQMTRTFIGLTVNENDATNLKLIVGKLNNCLDEFRLPTFYQDPSFHISILWCLGNEKSKLLEIKDEIFDLLTNSMNFFIGVNHLQCKCGNKLFNFALNSKYR